MAFFAVTTARGPKWNPSRSIREQAGWEEHADFADRLVADGHILLGGPVEDRDVRIVALIGMEAPGVASIDEIFAGDPWVRSGVIEVRDVRPWTIWLRTP